MNGMLTDWELGEMVADSKHRVRVAEENLRHWEKDLMKWTGEVARREEESTSRDTLTDAINSLAVRLGVEGVTVTDVGGAE